MKRVLLFLLIASGLIGQAQVYNNEWINFNNTYYKFKVGKTGMYRIPQSALASIGLGAAPAEQFQLWRNGVQIPIYTSTATGTLGASDFLEFWGEMNDGKPDKDLYRNPDFQVNDKWSLETDTATYFLTLNTSGSNLRIVPTVNNVSANTLTAEPYFLHTSGFDFREKWHGGYAVLVSGQYLYSSSYDRGEGWTSGDIATNGTRSLSLTNLFAYAAGPDATLNAAVSGNAIFPRNYRVKVNGDSLTGGNVDFYNYARSTKNFPTSLISGGTAAIEVSNVCNQSPCPAGDRMVIHRIAITYPRVFNFGGSTNFEFSLPASSAGNYLEIQNFNYGAVPPILLDLTNGKRYIADLASAPLLKFLLEPSSVDRKLVLVSQEVANTSLVTSFEERNFVNYHLPANQGDYLIISNKILFNGQGGNNPVEEYRQYRASQTGGGYNAQIYLADELIDQFGFGIKKNPLGIRNFIRFARHKFAASPQHVFIVGRGLEYPVQRSLEANEFTERLNLVPTFGIPASDVLLAAEPGSSQPEISIGRISVVAPHEVTDYLTKIKEYEQVQTTASPNIGDKAWMKNVLHLSGGHDQLATLLGTSLRESKRVISDTLFGAKVYSLSKETSSSIEQINNAFISSLFQQGLSMITYFGHSSSSTLEYNVENPNEYNNPGKYPLFVALGCNAGSIFNFNTGRFFAKTALSENYLLTPQKGSAGFIASTHFGIVHYLNIWKRFFYQSVAYKDYGNTVGNIMKSTATDVFSFTTQQDFYSRSNVEQLNYLGDPAIKINTHAKPDYAISDPMVKTSAFVSVLQKSLKVNVSMLNIGKAVNKDLVIEVKHQGPDQAISIAFRDTIEGGLKYEDSLTVELPIDASIHKGLNKLTVTLDPENEIDELFESNNSVTKEYVVYEDEARPVYPYNFAIVNTQNVKFFASTANPNFKSMNYKMEIDTTERFDSPVKKASAITSSGGVLEFTPDISFTDSTVYYWRVGVVEPSNGVKWSNASFIYLPNSDVGFNQSHYAQHLKSEFKSIYLDSVSRKWSYDNHKDNVFLRNGVFPSASTNADDFAILLNGDGSMIRSVCGVSGVIVNVIDPVSFKPWFNATAGTPGQNGSDVVCGNERRFNFQYNILNQEKRKRLVQFLDSIPDGNYVIVRNISGTDPNSNTYPDTWKSDTSVLGEGNSLYHRLYNNGFTEIDSFNRPRAWIFMYKKGDINFHPESAMSQGIYDKITLSVDCNTPDTVGYITSPAFGPAKSWKQLHWDGASLDSKEGDFTSIDVIGVKPDQSKTILIPKLEPNQKLVDISSIDASQYSHLQLRMRNADSIHRTPYQLGYWRLTYDPIPEAAVAPNIALSMKDTVEVNEPIGFKVAFKNISQAAFDSMRVKLTVIDKNNVSHVLSFDKHKPLNAHDTLLFHFNVNTRNFVGANTLLVEINPEMEQLERYQFNNFLHKSFFVRADTINPFLDVTFDNKRILNNDLVSAKPEILIKLKDDAKWMLLDETSIVSIKVRYPNGTIKAFSNFDNDTLSFNKSQGPTQQENAATINFKPYFNEDGTYELIISGTDKSNNKAGVLEYRVRFQVLNKPMISNLLNYPNPFTTSTAFVFTLTGSEVPQNIRIQIMTVTGKIVKEITKQELGQLNIGRNITEYKWDGTDQYGQKLANGVYLYRVITNLNGKSLDKYKAEGDQTDKYFNKGYGKMYLMR